MSRRPSSSPPSAAPPPPPRPSTPTPTDAPPAALALLPAGRARKNLPALLAELERWEAGALAPAAWNALFLPHYFGRFPPADFHHVYNTELHALHRTRGVKCSDVAPRGGAKSTWKTLAYPLRCVLEGWERYVAILSDSSEQANGQLGHIRAELEGNARLRRAYPEACGPGLVWNESKLVLPNGCAIEAFGAGKKIRGRRNRADRPTLVVFDDVQSNDDVTSPTLRARAWEWATREVIPAGDERTNFLAVGSALHRDCVAVRLGQLAGWRGRTYRAVHAWPERADLWAEFERLSTNLADDARESTAREYYARHRADMDRGARVYWPERFPLVDLMLRRSEVGVAAFECEYQGVPGTLDGAEWPAAYFDRTDLWFDAWPDDIVLRLQALDPSKGSSSSADFQAHVCLGLSRFGVLFADADLRREPGWVERALDIAAGWNPSELVAEGNNTMGLLRPAAERLLAERRERGSLLALTYTERIHSTAKAVRIRVLNDYLRRGQLRVRNTPGGRLLVEQLRDWPNGDHDDGPDALATAVIRLQELVG